MAYQGADRRAWDRILWAAQWALAGTFFTLGLLKAFLPAEALQRGLGLVQLAPEPVLLRVGVVEIAGALGVVLPAAIGVVRRLTSLAAACLSGVALLGVLFPESGAGLALPLPNLLLAALGAWVAYGRSVLAPIAPLGLRAAADEDREQYEAFLAADVERRRRETQEERRRAGAA
jgi:hypothetical protein